MRTRASDQHPKLMDDEGFPGTTAPQDPLDTGRPTFAVVRKGYDTTQVDQHLAWLAAAPPPGEDEAYMEADRIVADARRLAAEICFGAAQRERQAEIAAARAREAAEQAEAELAAARAEVARLLAGAREVAAEGSAFHEVS